jgi:hypothetical protein
MTNQVNLPSPEYFERWNTSSFTPPGIIEPGCAYTAIHFEPDKHFPANCCANKRACRRMLQDLKIKII